MAVNTKSLIVLGIIAAILSVLTIMTFADPQGPNAITIGDSSRNTKSTDGFQINVAAGNVTSLTISDLRITEHWAGFFGNVTATIVLDDASNNTMFDWAQASPKGEVFASNGSSVTWAHLKCVNLSGFQVQENSTWSQYNATRLERFFQINTTERDGFDETFNDTYGNSTGFRVGSLSFGPTLKCPMTYTYVDQGDQNVSFGEVLMSDNVSIIFAALLEDTTNGFRQGDDPHDFQMLVAENGISGFETSTTPYYFFVELE